MSGGDNTETSISEKRQEASGSVFSTFMHVVCTTVGSGIFYLPASVSKAGWLNIVVLFLFSIISYYSGHLTVKCLYYKKGKKLETLHDIGYHSFGMIGGIIVQVSFYLSIFGSAWVYLILCGLNTSSVIEHKGIKVQVWYAVYGFVILIPLIFIKSIKEASVLSAFGVLTTFLAVVVIIIYSFIDISKTPSNYDQIKVLNLSGTATALSSFAFAYGGSFIYPQIESSMKDKSKWKTSLLYSIAFIFLIYAFIVISGMFAYGLDAQAPIYNNLPQNSWVVKAVLVLITLHFVFTIPIFICIVCLQIETKYNITVSNLGKKKELVYRGAFRSAVVALLTGFTVLIDDSKFASNLIGAIPTIFIICILPPVSYLKLYGFKNRSKIEYVGCFVILVVGVFCLIYGTYEVISDHVKSIKLQKL